MKYLRRYITAIGIFVVFDQLVKIIIYNFFYNVDISIIGNIIRFHQVINTNLRFGGNYFTLFRNFGFTVIINVIIIIFLIRSYSFYRSKKDVPAKIVNLIYILVMSGSFCSLLDKIVWNGSLDLIQIPRLYIFDIKDIYISIAQCIFISCCETQ
ncbi:MAG: signal peptidase II [Lachnospiraceae bacterium]|jgi:signal peptidase II|nr:signal peptidase II [Lachnospiraceae bacterium]